MSLATGPPQTIAQGNSFSQSQILDLSSQQIWASSFPQLLTSSLAKASRFAQLATLWGTEIQQFYN